MDDKKKTKAQLITELEELRKQNFGMETEFKLPVYEYQWGEKNLNEMTILGCLQNVINIFPYFIIIIDEDHNILLANDTAQNLIGKKLDNIIGCYCPKLVHGLDEPFPGCPLEDAIEKGHYIKKICLIPSIVNGFLPQFILQNLK